MNERTARDYLLLRTAESERTLIEERIFQDAAFFEWLQAVELGLIEDYVAGSLSEADRQRFEDAFLGSPERCRRIDLLQTMLRSPAPGERRMTVWASLGLAAAALLLGVVLGTRSPAHIQPSSDSKQSTSVVPTEGVIVEVRLAEGRQRGNADSETRTVIPAEKRLLRLRLVLGASPATPCYASITGDDLPNQIVLPAHIGSDATLVLDMPTSALSSGDYVVRAFCSGTPLGTFPLHITRP